MIISNLRVLMAQRNLKASDVFRDTGIARSTLSQLLKNNGVGIQFETLDKLCSYLDVGICDIIKYHDFDYDFEITDFAFPYVSANIRIRIESREVIGFVTISCLEDGPESLRIYVMFAARVHEFLRSIDVGLRKFIEQRVDSEVLKRLTESTEDLGASVPKFRHANISHGAAKM